MFELKKDLKILFQGDSITDNLRADVTEFIGIGYTRLVTAYLRGQFPQFNIQAINRAVSGNRTCDLVKRWDYDTIQVKPDICTILIGVNDTWRRFDSDDPTSEEVFEKNYREILEKNKNNNIKTVIIEPFMIFSNPINTEMYEKDLINKQPICKKLAEEYGCDFIPMHSIFQEACKKQEPRYWSWDGVHPAISGHFLIAKEILKLFGINL